MDTESKVCINALLEAINDKDDLVNDSIHKSLCKIAAGSNSNDFLLTFCEFWSSKKKIDDTHAANILRALEQICMQHGEGVDTATAKQVTAVVIQVMTLNKEYVPGVQMPCSGILVALGNFHCKQVLEPMLELLKPGVIPHFTIPHTMGTLAATNIEGTVPFIKPILAKMLPTLGMIKMDPLKQAFAYALGHFSTAIIDFYGNNENQESAMTKDDYSTEISIAFDMLYVHWIHSGEVKVIENVLEAMGPMISLLPTEKVKELIPKLISTVVSLYRKSSLDCFYITQTLTLILIDSIKRELALAIPLVEPVTHSMFNLILTTPDYDQPQKIKNHFELLRCFDILVSNFPTSALEYLFQQTKNNNEEDRMKAVVVLTHLVTSSETSIKNVIERFVSILKAMIVAEHSIKMKRILLKAIVALAYRNCLQQSEDSVLLEFIIKQCCCTKVNDSPSSDKSNSDGVINDCENSLYLLSSTVTNIKCLLWPLLLRGLLTTDYTKSISIITRCLTQLIKAEDGEENSESVKHSSVLPSNESVYVRCMSLLVNHSDQRMTHNLLTFLSKYCESIHKDLKVSWELDLQKLLAYLECKDFTEDVWEGMILDLFRSAIFLVNENSWVDTVSHKILEQIPQNEKYVHQKGMLYKFLSILLCHVVDLQSIGFRLDVLFNALHHSSPEESKYIAESLGIASIKHGLTIVERLDTLAKEIDSRKSNRFLNFSFMKNSKQVDIDNMKYSITLCYGEVAKEVLDANVLNRLVGMSSEDNGGSIRWAAAQLRLNSPSSRLLQASLTTVHLLAKAIHTASLDNIIIHDKWNLLNLVLDQMFDQQSNDLHAELYPAIIKATTSLILLPKHLAPEERNVVLRTVCNKVYHSVQFLKLTFESSEEEMQNDVFAKVMNDSLCSLNNLIMEFMKQSTCPSTLDDILSILDEWIDHENEQVRSASMRSVQVALICFIQNIKLTYENPSRFGQTGVIVGKMVPRCSDQSMTVRYIAIDCIKTLIQIVDLYDGQTVDQNSEDMKCLSTIQNDIGTDDSEKLYSLISSLANVIGRKVPHQQSLQLIESLLGGLRNDDLSAKGCNHVLNIILNTKGADLYQNINDIMDFIFSSMLNVKGSIQTDLLDTYLTLAKHHPKMIVCILLLQPLPFENHINECWRVLAQDASVAALTIDHLSSMLCTEPLFEESLKYDNGKIVHLQALAAISGLSEIFSQCDVQSICNEKFSELFSMLYTILACLIGSSAPAHSYSRGDKFGFVPNLPATKLSPAKITLDTLKTFLINANCSKAAEACIQCTQLESGDHLNSFLNMVPALVETFCTSYPIHLSKVVTSLNSHARDTLMPKRIAVVAFFSKLVFFRCNEHSVLLETVMSTLSCGWKDTSLEVRAISLSGLSNIKYLKTEHQQHYMTPVLNALYNGLDDQQGTTSRTNVPLVAMVGLSQLLTVQALISKPIDGFPPVSQRIKSFFNTENSVLREASILLFGDIIVTQKSEALKEQALALFPCFLLHLADDDPNVVKACKQTLRKTSPTFNAQKTNSMIQNHLIDAAKLHLVDFTIDLVKNISKELPKHVPQFIENTSNYLSSPWDNIRANAAVVIGLLFLCYDVTDEDYEMNKKRLTSRLLQLLKDNNSRVRACTAVALSNLYQNTLAVRNTSEDSH